MDKLMNLLAQAGAKKTNECSPHFLSDTTTIEELLFAFNNNPGNSKVAEYISRQNFFDMIGKSRHEMVHSKMIAELLAGRYFEASQKTTLMHFFDIIIMRAKEQGVAIPQEFLKAVLTRTLCVESLADKQTEYSLANYLEVYGKKCDKDIDEKQRLDIFLRYNLSSALKKSGNKAIEIILENKVLAKEHNQQTQTYYDICADGRRAMQLFVYLSPISQRELSNYANVPCDMKPAGLDSAGNPVFIHISYQDIFDKIIAPLMNEKNLSKRNSIILEEYASCLELPAMPDNDEKLGTKELSIMATSDVEKQLLTEFMHETENAKLMSVAVAHHLGKKLYSYSGAKCLTFDQALQEALKHYTQHNSEYESMIKFKDVIGGQKGGARFLIYAVQESEDKLYYVPTYLFEYKGLPFKTITDALKVAVKDYKLRTGKNNAEIIDDFKPLYAKQKHHQWLFKDNDEPIPGGGHCAKYSQTEIAGLYVSSNVLADKLNKINAILGHGSEITIISSECYHKLLLSGDNIFWECYDKHQFSPLQGTRYFYRKNTEDRIEKINEILIEQINENPLSESACDLLKTFYDNNRKLILSIYRILMENEQDIDVYEQMKKIYKNLLKV